MKLNLLLIMSLLTACSDNQQQADKTVDNTQAKDSVVTNTASKTIVFFGNSLTAGYGIEPTQAFPALIQQKLDSLKLPYKVINAGVSGETSSGG
ncbi:MAG TPA: arylesterase, partial [Chitinophagaceae bacterium]